MAGPTLPNFFLAGAPKAGTTSLYHQLSQHPEIFISPVKEPSYFALEARPENFVPELQEHMRAQMWSQREQRGEGAGTFGVVDCWDDYLRLFEGVREERAIGEGSVCYLWSKTAAREIAAVNPAAKIVLVLRHPAERAFSQYLHALSDGAVTHTFSDHIATSLRSGNELSAYHPFLEFGMYSDQVQRFLAYFPPDQVRVWIYEETVKDWGEFFREVLEFLGVDASFVPAAVERHHAMEVPKVLGVAKRLRGTVAWASLRRGMPPALKPWVKRMIYRRRGAVTMGLADRKFLIQYYREDVRRLEKILERDLSDWLT